MIIKCAQCGNEFKGKTKRKEYCQICAYKRRVESQKRNRNKSIEYRKEYSKLISKRYRAKLAQYNQQQREYYHANKKQMKQFEYCRQQKGMDDLGCLECKLPECIQLEDRADEVQFKSGFEDRYNEIKEKTWLSVDFEQEFEEGEEWWRTPIVRHNKRSKK